MKETMEEKNYFMFLNQPRNQASTHTIDTVSSAASPNTVVKDLDEESENE